MKSTDLMVGDWVMAMLATPEPMKMEYIDNGGWLAHLEPILLTPEILVANGFACEGWGWISKQMTGEGIYTITIGDVWLQMSKIEGKWNLQIVQNREIQCMAIISGAVHQLQHALRLCGLNDLADNFKLA